MIYFSIFWKPTLDVLSPAGYLLSVCLKVVMLEVDKQLYIHSPALSIAVVKLFGPGILRNYKHSAPPKKVKCLNRTYGEKKKA